MKLESVKLSILAYTIDLVNFRWGRTGLLSFYEAAGRNVGGKKEREMQFHHSISNTDPSGETNSYKFLLHHSVLRGVGSGSVSDRSAIARHEASFLAG